jgi:hypothetical protein
MAAVPPEVKILDYRKFPSMDPKRLGKEDVLITYMLGAEGPFTVTLPYEEIAGLPEVSALEKIKDYIRRAQAERLAFIGKSFSL